MHRGLILSVFYGDHDSCITFADSKKVLLHLAAEKYFRKKHYRTDNSEMEELILEGLKYLNKSAPDIRDIFLSPWGGNDFSKTEITIQGKKFTPKLTSHHLSHIGTVLPAKFEDALVICADGGSEDGSTKFYLKKPDKIIFLTNLDDTILTGKFYGTITQIVIDPGFKKAHVENPGKLMGLAALGSYSREFYILINENKKLLNTLHYHYGALFLNQRLNISGNFNEVWKDKRRCDFAFTAQKMWVDAFLDKIKEYKDLSENICLCGGCALNVVLNSALAQTGWFRNIYVSPVSGDDGQSLGAILYHYPNIECDYPFLGRGFGEIENIDEVVNNAVGDLLAHKIIAWYQGRSEIGARALGHRSFLGLPDSIEIRVRLSEKIKGREPYRPVSAILIEEFLPKFTQELTHSPYMTFAPHVNENIKKDIPAIVHVDGTSRIQTLNKKDNPILYKILEKVGEKTGYPVLMNTSFNIAGEPIVDTPEDAINTFNKCSVDILYINGKRYQK